MFQILELTNKRINTEAQTIREYIDYQNVLLISGKQLEAQQIRDRDWMRNLQTYQDQLYQFKEDYDENITANNKLNQDTIQKELAVR